MGKGVSRGHDFRVEGGGRKAKTVWPFCARLHQPRMARASRSNTLAALMRTFLRVMLSDTAPRALRLTAFLNGNSALRWSPAN
jgi:hypothetical protein